MKDSLDIIVALFVAWQVLWSVAAFFALWNDKNSALGHRWRTPEDRLHSYEFWGGWLGSGLAQRLWRHKIHKPSYQQVYRRTALWWGLASLFILCVWLGVRLNA